MRVRKVLATPNVYALAFEPAEEAIGTLTRFAREQQLAGAHFSGIGEFREATLGYFEIALKDYRRIHVREQVEVMSFHGNISTYDGAAGTFTLDYTPDTGRTITVTYQGR